MATAHATKEATAATAVEEQTVEGSTATAIRLRSTAAQVVAMETAMGTVTATEELRTAVVTARGTVMVTASATAEPLVVEAALATVSGIAAATGFYLHCIMELPIVTHQTRIIMAMTTLFPTTVMDYMALIRFLAVATVITTAA